jgi:2-polyprenyl-6-hydroxyphenyl methylase/3-demethylubiquinone-9 3-methyltransferase
VRHEELVRSVPSGLTSTAKVLDVGCGGGYLIDKLRRAYPDWDYHGCDWLANPPDGHAFRYTKVDLNERFLQSYGDQSFDLTFCSDVLEHLENPARMLREMARVTRDNGLLMLSLPNSWNVLERLRYLANANFKRYRSERKSGPHGHISLFTSDILQSLADRASLDIVSIRGGHMVFAGVILPWIKSKMLSYNLYVILRKSASKNEHPSDAGFDIDL